MQQRVNPLKQNQSKEIKNRGLPVAIYKPRKTRVSNAN